MNSQTSLFRESLIYKNIKEKNKNDPSFALYSSIHFMSALSQICSNDMNPEIEKIQSLSKNDPQSSQLFESFSSCLMSLNFIQTLSAFKENENNSIYYMREAIPCWYYSLYHSLLSVIKVFNNHGNIPETHRGAINTFSSNIYKYYPKVISYVITDLSRIEEQLNVYRNSINIQRYDIVYKPENYEQSIGAYLSYFKGTCDWIKESTEEELKKEKKILNFRSKENRTIRDNKLQRKTCSFYDLAFRFRGKAHYRDSIYLCLLESKNYNISKQFLENCFLVAKKISIVNYKILKKRIGNNLVIFENFIKEAKSHTNIENRLIDEIYF